MKSTVVALTLLLASSAALAEDLLHFYGIAQQNDPQIAAAKATRNATFENEPIARSLLLPDLRASGDLNWQDVDTNGPVVGNFREDYTDYTAALTVTQPIYRRDRLYTLEQSKTVVKQANAAYAAAEQDLIIRLATAYFDVLSAEDTLEFANANKKATARQLDQAKQRFEVGLIAITGVYEAQARFDQQRADVISAENALDNAWEVLREIVGPMGPTELSPLREDITVEEIRIPSAIEDWSETAAKNNPNVASARLAAEAARQDIEIQRSGHYPTFDLIGAYRTAESESEIGRDTDTLSAGVQLAVPIYSGGGVVASTRQARFNFEAAQEDFDRVQRAAERQVRDAFRGIQSNLSRVEALEAATVSAESALEATTAGFDVGTRTLVDVLNRQSELFLANNDLSQARYDYILNLLSLEQAAGTLDLEDLETVNAWLALGSTKQAVEASEGP
jgi:outer membrane protein